MDTFEKINDLKNKYKHFLAEQYPEWTEGTINARVSDAFYIWNNTVLPGFWKTLLSDESMQKAADSLYHHFRYDLMVENYAARVDRCLDNLYMLKENQGYFL